VIVFAQEVGAFRTNGAIAQCRAFGGTRHDPDVLRSHVAHFIVFSWKVIGTDTVRVGINSICLFIQVQSFAACLRLPKSALRRPVRAPHRLILAAPCRSGRAAGVDPKATLVSVNFVTANIVCPIALGSMGLVRDDLVKICLRFVDSVYVPLRVNEGSLSLGPHLFQLWK
jgi:hypothetical protein